MQPTLHMLVVRRAAEMLGSAETLGLYLKEPKAQIDHWMDGSAPAPVTVFLNLIDLLSSDALQSSLERPAMATRIKLESHLSRLIDERHEAQRAVEAAYGRRESAQALGGDADKSRADANTTAARLRLGGIDAKIDALEASLLRLPTND